MAILGKEIGSEFWDVAPCSERKLPLFPVKTRYFLSGRSALSHVIEDIQARHPLKSAMLPSYCCYTMIEPFLSHGVSVHFYPVYLDCNGQLKQEIPEHHGCDAVLIMEYFGYASPKIWTKKYDGIVIADTTHSIFTCTPSKINADYVYGSMRKWAGFWTGGYAWHVNGVFALPKPSLMDHTYIKLRKQAMEEKAAYINAFFEVQKEGFLSLFAKASDMMTSKSNLCAAERDIEFLNRFDAHGIKKRRRKNAKTLLKYVSEYALFPELKGDDCPLFVPIVLPHEVRDKLRKHLIEHQIYCPVHWPVSSKHLLTQETERIYREELSLVCDQRYDQTDMERMGQAITDFLHTEGL